MPDFGVSSGIDHDAVGSCLPISWSAAACRSPEPFAWPDARWTDGHFTPGEALREHLKKADAAQVERPVSYS